MQLPPAPVLLLALFVVLFAVFGRHRTTRPRQLADIGGFMSSSYAADVDGGDAADADRGDAAEGRLAPATAGSPARLVWADTGTWPTEPIVVEPLAADPVLVDETGDETDSDHTDGEVAPEPAPRTLHAVAGSPRGRDPLTGMLDRDAFDDVMAQEEARQQRYGHPATVIVFELDGLARLVDRLGPEPGGRIEVALADAITRLARRADHVARLDRGRYAVLLPETDEVAAINYVERIRNACELWLESGAIAMRLSIGWASTNGDAGLTGAIRVATDRMRQEQRRNARGVGDVVPDLELIEGDGPTQAAAGL